MSKDRKTKILYIVGCSRSGSTLLDRLLSSSDKVFSSGELNYLRDYIKERTSEEATKASFSFPRVGSGCFEFWESIIDDISKNNYSLFNRSEVSRTKFDFIKRFFTRKKLKQRYNDKEIFDLILKRAYQFKGEKVEFILDSSKGLKRLMYLLDNEGLDVYVVHLVRDVRGRIYSIQKNRSDFWISILGEWLLKNFFIALFLKKKLNPDKYIRLGYDRFVKNPSYCLEKMSDKFNLEIDIDSYLSSVNENKDYNRVRSCILTLELVSAHQQSPTLGLLFCYRANKC